MNVRWILLLAFMSAGWSALYAECRMGTVERSGIPVRVMENRFLRAEVVPQSCGAVIALRYLPLAADLMPPFEYTVEKIDLLPDQVQVSSGGGRTLFWGMPYLAAQNMAVENESAGAERATLDLLGRYYQGISCTMRRQLSLEHDASLLKLGITLTNSGSTPLTLRPWDNLVVYLNPEKKDDILIPGRGGTSKVGTVGVQPLEQDRIYVRGISDFAKDVRIAAARNWVARRNDASPLIFAVRLTSEPMSPDGFFYSWGQGGNSPLQTMEAVLPPVELAPGKERSYELEYLVFQGLKNLKEICGDLGINCEVQGKQLEWQFAAVRPFPAQALTVYAGEQQIGELNVPALKTGETVQLSMPLGDIPSGNHPVRGTFSGGQTFQLLEPMLKR
jgi:hypothetical protein